MSEEHCSPRPPLGGAAVPGATVRVLAFDNSNGSQLNGLLADSSVMAGVHHISHVLIGLRSLQGGKQCKVSLKGKL